jgi:hypothetical protein
MSQLDQAVLDELYNCILTELPRDKAIVLYWANGDIDGDGARYISRKLNEEGFRSAIFEGDFPLTNNNAKKREYPVDLGRMLGFIRGRNHPRVREKMMQFVKIY